MLRIRLLGELELDLDGEPLAAPASRRARALLGWLALHPGLHARSEVAARFWPDVLDRSARESLRTALSTLRRSLGHAGLHLEATRERVGLADGEGVWVDAREFDHLEGAGRFEEAVGLCRGEMLAGLDDEWALGARDAHRERLGAMLGRLADAATAAGDRGSAVRRARERAALDPLSEDAGRALIRALAAAGDRAAALSAYERLRERLLRELGIGPSAQTRALVEELRRPAGAVPAAAGAAQLVPEPWPPPLPAALARRPRTPLVGRADDLGALHASWDRAAAGEPGIALLAGEPGIGKTRLAAELGRALHAQGAAVLLGRCSEETLVPYQPFVEALAAYSAGTSPERLREDAGPVAGELARLLPELRGGLPEPIAGDPDGARWRLFDAVASVLGVAAGRGGLLLVLDDLHWADGPTLLMLTHLIRMPPPPGLLVVAAYRESELARTHPLAGALAELRRESMVERLVLKGLAEPDVQAMVAQMGAPPSTARAVHEETEGNPFFVEEMVRHLIESGAPAGLAGLPEGIREVIGRRLSRLGREANRALAVAAVIGREFDLAVLEAVSESPEEELLDALDETLRARLVREEPGRPGRFAFSHALVRQTVYSELSAARRVKLHGRVADAIETLHADRLVDIAHHLYEAAPDGDAHRAAGYAARAGEQATARLAWEESAVQYSRALEVLELAGETGGRTVCELHVALGDACNRAGDTAQAREAFSAAAAGARTLGDAELLARAALGHGGVGVVIAEPDPATVALLDEALAALPPTHHALRARLCGRLAVELYYAEPERSHVLGGEAVEAGRQAQDARALADALNAQHVVLWDPDHLEGRLGIAAEMIALGEQSDDREVVLQGLNWRAVDLFEAGEMGAFAATITAHAELADALRLPAYQWYGPLWRAVEAVLACRYEEAASLADEACRLGRRAGDRNAELFREILRYQELVQRGRFGEVDVEAIERRVAISPVPDVWRTGLAWAYAENGRPEEARGLLAHLAAKGFARAPRDPNWLSFIAECGEVSALVGASEYAPELYELLIPFRGRHVTSARAVGSEGSAERALGLLAAMCGRHDLAGEHFEAALSANARMGNWAFVVRTQVQYAALLRARGAPGDDERAAALSASATEASERLGIEPLDEPRF